MEKVFGIDVSRWQGNFNFSKAITEGIKFAILKAGGSDAGKYKDSKYESYYTTCKQLGIPVGAYYFGNDTTEAAAIESAKHFISLLKGKQFEYPVYYDVESKAMQNLSKANLTKVVNAFCSTMENAGFYVGIYSTKYWFTSELDDAKLARYTHWVACWTKNPPSLTKSSLDMWQFGGETNLIRSNKVAGVVCDQDYCYKDFPGIITRSKLNGFNGTSTTFVTPEVINNEPVVTPPATPTPVTTPTNTGVTTLADIKKLKNGAKVKLTSNAKYYNGKAVPNWVKKSTLYYRGINNSGVIISTKKTGAVTGVVKPEFILIVK